ncbi:hypothetical protein JRQ81_010213 [Phrynocephalus forsythii]|uniref:SAM domain-containing protein n=1 Tax=Phrynocephalus forsythii TaxID=171643 RepID=A0A9Q1ARC4_9SAUR|nr:hypothetical protein JRQ81_010213 [Phrynocephalus forsythii]
MSTRYHQAAADSNLGLLKEATRKDLNTSDRDGMTPTLLAAYHGNLEALEIICRRGGDPDKCDIWGNTPLHHAASNGHIHCVAFLINLGANIFALDNDLRSPLDAAASRNQYECVNLLDNAATEQNIKNPKKVAHQKAEAQRDVQRQIRECERRQEKHEQKMAQNFSKGSVSSATATRPKISNLFTSSSLRTFPKQLKDTFSLRGKKKGEILDNREAEWSGSQKDIPAGRPAVMGMFNENDEEDLAHEFQGKASLSEYDDSELGPKSIFHRPGLGNIVFRSHLSTGKSADPLLLAQEKVVSKVPNTLFQVPEDEGEDEGELDPDANAPPDSHPEEPWIEEEIAWDDGEMETTPLEVFLASQNLNEWLPTLMRENIDLEALLLCSDEDLRNIQMQLGPRKKILHALERRQQALANPGKARDTQL